jgi:uncharacterized protein YeaO (DUF488 family)
MIYTSYFAKLKSLPEEIIPISICAKTPSWYKGLQYKELAPTYEILMKYKRDGNKEDYIKSFYEQVLRKLNPNEVVFDLGRLADKDNTHYSYNICLICYEKSSDFCHRHLIADWLRKNGYECEEWVGK